MAVASWPAGVPLPTGTVQQISAAGGLYMVTVLVASGLTTACSDAVGQYRAAGWSAPGPAVNTATDPTVLRGPAYVATVVCTAADHSPFETLVTVHLGPA